MDWTRSIDAYCERTSAAFWAEPVNALTNLAFVLAAVWAWRRTAGDPGLRLLAGVLGAIGVGSFLFHTVATPWASLADTLPILIFVLIYLYLSNRRYLRWPVLWAALGTAAFVPYAAALGPLFGALPFFRISAVYWVLPVLIGGYAAWMWRRAPGTGRGLAAGAGLLSVSLLARSADGAVCGALPVGTHFLWHCLNAVMLAWMIEVMRRHGDATRDGTGGRGTGVAGGGGLA